MTPTSSDGLQPGSPNPGTARIRPPDELRVAPLRERLRLATAGRLAVLVVVVAGLATAGRGLVDPAGASLLAWSGAAYLVVNLLVAASLTRSRHLRVLLDAGLIADAGALAVLVAVTGGPFSPLLAVLYAALVAATVLFGWGSGLRLALLASVGLLWALTTVPAQGAGRYLGVLGVTDGTSQIGAGVLQAQTVTALVTTWLLVAVTAALTSLNERHLRRSNLELASLHELNTDLEASLETADITRAVANGLVRELGYRRAVVWTLEPDENGGPDMLVPSAAAGYADASGGHLRSLALLPTSYPVGNAVREGTPRLVTRNDPRPGALEKAFGKRSPLVVVPLAAEGRLLGLLTAEVAKPVGRAPRLSNRDLRILGALAAEASLVTDNARMHAELRNRSITDGLTGLYNHGHFQERLREEVDRVVRRSTSGEERSLSVVLIDLDHFKRVNDTYGHPTGDEVLRTFALVATDVLRATDLVFRYGGEEFAVILVEEAASAARQAAERLRQAVEATTFRRSDGTPLGSVTASFGVATGAGAGLTREWLVETADQALYVAKRSGRNRVVHGADLPEPMRSAGEQPDLSRERPA